MDDGPILSVILMTIKNNNEHGKNVTCKQTFTSIHANMLQFLLITFLHTNSHS